MDRNRTIVWIVMTLAVLAFLSLSALTCGEERSYTCPPTGESLQMEWRFGYGPSDLNDRTLDAMAERCVEVERAR